MISLTPKEKESSRWPKLSFHSFPQLAADIYLVTPRKAEIGLIIHVYIAYQERPVLRNTSTADQLGREEEAR